MTIDLHHHLSREPYHLPLMNARKAATRFKKSYGGRLAGKVVKTVLKHAKIGNHVDADDEPSGLDIQCIGEAPQIEHQSIQQNPIIHPLKNREMMAPGEDFHESEVKPGRRKSSGNDYLVRMSEYTRPEKQEYEGEERLDLQQFPAVPTTRASKISRSRDSVGHLIAARQSTEASLPQMPAMERRCSRIRTQPMPQPTAESAARDYMRHRKHCTSTSVLMRQPSRRSVQSKRMSVEPSAAREEAMLLLAQDSKQTRRKEVSKPPCDLSLLKTRSEVIERAVPSNRESYVSQWDNYLNDYTAGRYNIITPPQPPRRHSSFTFLPALSPHNEEERMAVLGKLNPQWSEAQEAEGMSMVKQALREFNASGASISLVISDAEIVKVQEGYGLGRDTIKRSQSFAAHALLSTEVLVVLDTHEDWRFAGNPLVTQDPNIRFYAGAPMITSSGAVIGVFAIFGYEPIEEFTASHRRRLTDFSSCAMLNIIPRTRKGSGTPLTRPGTPMVHGQPTPQASFDMAETAKQLVHPAFREGFKLDDSLIYDSPGTLETPQFKDEIQIWNANVPTPGQPTPAPLLTPPSSKPEDEVSPTDAGPSYYGKNHKDLFLAMHHPNLTFRKRQSDGTGIGEPVLRSWTPRPFTDSDMTSLDGRPHPNTPSFDTHVSAAVNKSMEDDDDSYFNRSIVDPSYIYEQEKARIVIEHIADLDAAAFYRTDRSKTPTNASKGKIEEEDDGDTERSTLYREASRPLLSYYEPPEERVHV